MAENVLVDFPFMESACYFPSLESLLDFSITCFHAAVAAKPDTGLISKFRSVFYDVIEKYDNDPPLEAVWFFSALVFYDTPDNLPSILKFISAFTASSPAAAKPVALLAPVVSELFHSAKPRKNIEALVKAVLRCISIYCSRGKVKADAGSLLPGFEKLVKVWTVRKKMCNSPLQVLFPLVGDEARQKLTKEGCSVTFLAGVVVAEAFLLMLCLKVQGEGGVPSSDLQIELRDWAISCISEFKKQQFFGVLLNMLVNPPLPVYSPLSADEEMVVRVVLYDALILLHQSVASGAEVDQADSSHPPILVSRLVMTVEAIYDAINDARHKGDHGIEMSYINTFSSSNIPGYLTSWAIHQAEPIEITPEAFLKWLVDLEDKGLKVFGDNFSRIKEKLMRDEGKNDNQSRINQSDADLFFIDKQSRQEGMDTKGGEGEESVEMETADSAFMPAALYSKVMANDTRKRKDCGNEDATVVMYVKHKAEDSSDKDYLQATNGTNNGSDAGILDSDVEMEETG